MCIIEKLQDLPAPQEGEPRVYRVSLPSPMPPTLREYPTEEWEYALIWGVEGAKGTIWVDSHPLHFQWSKWAIEERIVSWRVGVRVVNKRGVCYVQISDPEIIKQVLAKAEMHSMEVRNGLCDM